MSELEPVINNADVSPSQPGDINAEQRRLEIAAKFSDISSIAELLAEGYTIDDEIYEARDTATK